MIVCHYRCAWMKVEFRSKWLTQLLKIGSNLSSSRRWLETKQSVPRQAVNVKLRNCTQCRMRSLTSETLDWSIRAGQLLYHYPSWSTGLSSETALSWPTGNLDLRLLRRRKLIMQRRSLILTWWHRWLSRIACLCRLLWSTGTPQR